MKSEDYLQPVPDGLLTRSSGPWAKEKLDYVRRYIDIFETSMKGKWPERNFIDLFAGPGKDLIKGTQEIILGSPLISITTRFPFTGYYFVDLDSENLNALQQRCSSSTINDRVDYINGDANQVVSKVVTNIRNTSPRSLNLAFLDPEGLELSWDTVAQLGSLRCDLIIHYSQQGLSRFMGIAYKSAEATIVDHFFGTPDWRKIYADWRLKSRKTGIHRELIDLYKDRLRALGYTDVKQLDEVDDEPLMRNLKRRAPLYRLIFASKHPLGEKFWKKVTERDLYGQKHLF